MIRRTVTAIMICIAATASALAAETVVTIPSRAGVEETILVDIPPKPVAAALLFPGGNGLFDIEQNVDGSITTGNENFLIRTRGSLAATGIATVVLNVPSDHANGIGEAFRKSPQHVADVAAAVAWINKTVGVPVWLVGTSMGSVSAASAAINLHDGVSGLVLTSTVSAPGRNSPTAGVSTLPLEQITVPVLVLDNTLDACPSSPPANAVVIGKHLSHARHVQVTLVPGDSSAPVQDRCSPISAHGYLGVEGAAVSAIVDFIKTY